MYIILPEGPRELAPNRFLLFFSTLTTPSGRDCSLHTLATTIVGAMANNKGLSSQIDIGIRDTNKIMSRGSLLEKRHQVRKRGATISCQVTIFPCVPTHPRDDGSDGTCRDFIGARDGVDVGRGGTRVEPVDRRKGGSSE